MRLRLAASLFVLGFAALSSPALTQTQDGPIVTAARDAETPEALHAREAIAYATPLPHDAPEQDYPLVAWCAARVEGHITLGRSLTNADAEDVELIRLAGLEASDFEEALRIAAPRQTPATLAAADAAADEIHARWAPLLAEPDEKARSDSFGYFAGIPGRCEHAARRIRENITTPPTTLEQAGLDENGAPKTN